jgi:hypothetical protein
MIQPDTKERNHPGKKYKQKSGCIVCSRRYTQMSRRGNRPREGVPIIRNLAVNVCSKRYSQMPRRRNHPGKE